MSRRPSAWLRTRAFLKRHPKVGKALFPALSIRRVWLRRRRARIDSIFPEVVDGELTIQIPRFRGTFTIGWRSDVLRDALTYGDYEPELAEVIESSIDSSRDVIDVGANVGLYTVLFAELVSSESRVLAIEPAPAAARRLRANIARNETGRVLVFEGAVAESSGMRTIHVVEGMEEYSSLHRIAHSGFGSVDQQKTEVKSETLDNLVKRFELSPGFVKLDIEGAEHSALQGAYRLLEDHRPVLLLESSEELLKPFGVSLDSVCRLLKQHRYELSNAAHPGAPIAGGGSILAVPLRGRQRSR